MAAERGDKERMCLVIELKSVIALKTVEQMDGLRSATGADQAIDGCGEGVAAGGDAVFDEHFMDGFEVTAAAEVVDDVGKGGVVGGETTVAD